MNTCYDISDPLKDLRDGYNLSFETATEYTSIVAFDRTEEQPHDTTTNIEEFAQQCCAGSQQAVLWSNTQKLFCGCGGENEKPLNLILNGKAASARGPEVSAATRLSNCATPSGTSILDTYGYYPRNLGAVKLMISDRRDRCSDYACPAGTSQKAEAASILGSSTAACCDPKLCTEDNVACPSGTTRKSSRQCDEDGCTAETCCADKMCSTFTCPANTTAKANTACDRDTGCTEAACCDQLCSGFECPANSVSKGDDVRCAGEDCDENTCCEAAPVQDAPAQDTSAATSGDSYTRGTGAADACAMAVDPSRPNVSVQCPAGSVFDSVIQQCRDDFRIIAPVCPGGEIPSALREDESTPSRITGYLCSSAVCPVGSTLSIVDGKQELMNGLPVCVRTESTAPNNCMNGTWDAALNRCVVNVGTQVVDCGPTAQSRYVTADDAGDFTCVYDEKLEECPGGHAMMQYAASIDDQDRFLCVWSGGYSCPQDSTKVTDANSIDYPGVRIGSCIVNSNRLFNKCPTQRLSDGTEESPGRAGPGTSCNYVEFDYKCPAGFVAIQS